MTFLPVLPLARYRLRFKASRTGKLPAYPGSAWRGALGHALKKTVCVTSLSSCPPCLLYRSCPYPYIFETPPPLHAQKMRKYTAAPHPFLLEVADASRNDVHKVGLILIGRGSSYLPYFIHAFERAGREGIGKQRVPMTLIDVSQADPPEEDRWEPIYHPGEILHARPPAVPRLPPQPSAIRLRLETPLRLKRGEHLITPEKFHFKDLFGALLRRVSMLTYFHTDTPLETDFAGLMEEARQVKASSLELVWKDWTRYSARQKTTMQMGGLLGEIAIHLTEQSPFWPYLWFGQWVHAGKGTSMGLGQYSLEAASLPKERVAEV